MYSIEFNGVSSETLGVMIAKRPGIPAPEERKTLVKIPGRDGSITMSENVYDDIAIEVEMNFVAEKEGWGHRYRMIKKWLLAGSGTLVFSDDKQVFHKVKSVIIDDMERSARVGGAFKVEFICDPFTYLVTGTSEYAKENVLSNGYAECHPIYKLTGEGMCTLTVNGKKMTANVGQNLTINTELMLAYRIDGTMQNTSVKGNYKDLYLKEGKNTIAVSTGFNLAVIPNWRCL